MKIAMFGQKRIPSREGGVEVVVEELSTRMVNLDNEVTVYNRRGHHVAGKNFDLNQPKIYEGVNIKSVFTINKRGLAALSSSFFAAIKCTFSDYDIIHIHAEGPAFMSWLPKLFGKKVIVTIHGLDWQRAKWGKFAKFYIKAGEKMAVKYADQIIVLSKSVQKYFKDVYDISTNYIPNGVNKPCIFPAKEIKNRWNLSKDEYILYLGRIVPEKGIHYLIKAWNEISTNKTLVIAGGSSDTDEYFKELKELAKNNKNNILFTGFVDGIVLKELYSNAYIYCLPSDLEGMPLSLLEAMSYGNCCITSDIPECKEVLKDKGFMFKKGDVTDLINVLQKLLENIDLIKKYKEYSSDYVCNEYNWDVIVNKTLELYRENG